MTQRDTIATKLVLKTLKESSHPLSANEILKKLNDDDFSFFKTTVYRILKRFVLDKKIIEITAKNRINYYELAKSQPHSHFFCKQCDKVFCLNDIPSPLPLNTSIQLKKNYKVHSHEHNLYGVCERCSTK